jgi:DNA gyrase subunit A
VNLLSLAEGEKVQATLAVRSFDEAAEDFVVLVTRKGVIKKTAVSAFSNPRRGGIIAINVGDDDELIAARRTSGSNEIILASKRGKSIRFAETQARPMGRAATGVLTVTANGYGKRTPLEDYRVQNRGGMGIITIRTSERNGEVIGIAQVVDDDEVMLITNAGKVLRCRVATISTMGRATQGVRLMELAEGEELVAMARLADEDAGEGEA